jgi:hypothetical protein
VKAGGTWPAGCFARLRAWEVQNLYRLTLDRPEARDVAEVTYYVALPFIASDDGVVAGEPTECFNPNAAVMRAEALSLRRAGQPLSGP